MQHFLFLKSIIYEIKKNGITCPVTSIIVCSCPKFTDAKTITEAFGYVFQKKIDFKQGSDLRACRTVHFRGQRKSGSVRYGHCDGCGRHNKQCTACISFVKPRKIQRIQAKMSRRKKLLCRAEKLLRRTADFGLGGILRNVYTALHRLQHRRRRSVLRNMRTDTRLFAVTDNIFVYFEKIFGKTVPVKYGQSVLTVFLITDIIMVTGAYRKPRTKEPNEKINQNKKSEGDVIS